MSDEGRLGVAQKVVESLSRPLTSGTTRQRAVAGGIWTIIITILCLTGLIGGGMYLFKDYVYEQQRIQKENQEFQRQIRNQVVNYEQIIIIGRKIDEKLKENIVTSKAARLMMIRFHEKRNEHEYLFASAQNWQPIDAVNDRDRYFQKQSLSHFSEMVDQFLQNKCWVASKLTQVNPMHRYWIERGAKSVIACPIRNLNLQLVGMLVAEYDQPYEEAEGYLLESRVAQLGGVLGGVAFSQDAIQSKQ